MREMPGENRRVKLKTPLKISIYDWLKGGELILFPSYCKLCGSFLERKKEKVVCSCCWESLFKWPASFCLVCGGFFQEPVNPHVCINCLRNPPPFTRHRSCSFYRGKLKDVILLYKYKGFRILGKHLASFADEMLGRNLEIWQGVEILIPVPLHPRRKKMRGFNQSAILAKELAKKKNFCFLQNSLIRTVYRPPQTSVEKGERESNVRGVFEVKKTEKIKNKIVCLIDDVYTTGATLRECARVLKKAGVKEVRALTIAQA